MDGRRGGSGDTLTAVKQESELETARYLFILEVDSPPETSLGEDTVGKEEEYRHNNVC